MLLLIWLYTNWDKIIILNSIVYQVGQKCYFTFSYQDFIHTYFKHRMEGISYLCLATEITRKRTKLSFDECSNSQHSSWQCRPDSSSIVWLYCDFVTSSASAIPDHAWWPESTLDEAIQSIPESFPASPVGAEAFPPEATISSTDTGKLLCIIQPSCHIKPPRSEKDQCQHFSSNLKCLHHKLVL